MEGKPLQGKVAIVTGAGSGIGKATALTLAQAGAAVALAGRRETRLRATKAEIDALGGTGEVFQTDIGDRDQCKALVKGTVDRLGRLDILVNNAVYQPEGAKGGESQTRHTLDEVTPEEWSKAFAVTVHGTFTMCYEAIPYLRQQERAFIVNIGTMTIKTTLRGAGVYIACKSALRGMSIVMSKELRENSGIRVHLIHPGGTGSERFADMIQAGARPDLLGAKLMPPQEIADVILFLVTRTGLGTIDEVFIRREKAEYWCWP
jgi:NAD(P)-dependent dehydrogenase (short-subunit alcohol dehydrogenase family)